MYIYLFSGTHWDREWYQTFQGFRYRLVAMLDHLVEYFEKYDRESVFHLDGQTIVLEDYAEINPEGYARLRELIRQGRVLIGPWYCMPDEFLISGEALIRNLLRGDALCRKAGAEPWKCGYICDIFGHMAQMPQIFRGFGITNAVLGRGTNEDTTPSMFCWRSPDGSEVDVFKLPDKNGYGCFTGDVCGQRVAGPLLPAEDEAFEPRARAHVEHEKARANVPFIVLWDALDHEPFHEETRDYVRRLQELYPEDTVLQTNLLDALSHIGDRTALPLREGELRESGKDLRANYIQVLTHVLSSRQSLKARNDHCQALLEKTVEPALLLFGQCGFHTYDAYRTTAWKHLLQNHPHDSICGCSIDAVHTDMLYRFDQVDRIADTLLEEGSWYLTNCIKFAGGENSWLTLMNTRPRRRGDYIEAEVPFHQAYAKWREPIGYEEIAAFRLYDDQNRELPYAITGRRTNRVRRGLGGGGVPCDLYTLLIPVSREGMGLSSIRIEESQKPVRQFGGFADSRGNLDNGVIRVELNPDGTVDLTDKATGIRYQNLLGINDSAEIGDGWKHVEPVMNECAVHSRLREASVLFNTPAASRVRLVRELEIPVCMREDRAGNWRAEERTTLRLEFLLTLARDARELDVSLRFDNTARDHVLRLVLPTGAQGPYYEANQDFCFVERDCRIDTRTGDWKEVMPKEAPMNGIVLKRDASGAGLAFVSGGGLHECIAEENGDLSVTLLRSFAKTQATNGEEGGQERFVHTYRWLLLPLDASVTRTQLQNRQDDLMAQPVNFVTLEPMDRPMLRLEGEACVSALKPAEDGSGDWILRIYNAEARPAAVRLVSEVPFRKAALCDLLEQPQEALSLADGQAAWELPAGKIQTVRLYA